METSDHVMGQNFVKCWGKKKRHNSARHAGSAYVDMSMSMRAAACVDPTMKL